MFFVKLGARAGKIARAVPSTRRSMGFNDYTIPNRIALYEVPNLITPGDIRRAIANKVQGVMNVQIDYKGFRPSARAIITMEDPEHLAKNLRALKPLSLCGTEVRAVAQYSPDVPPEKQDAVITGNGPGGNFPNVERNVLLWGLPRRTTIDEVAIALLNFKTEQKKGKPIIVKVEKPDINFTVFTRFLVTMASVSEAHRLVRAWHLTPWNKKSADLIRVQVLH